VIKVKDQKNGEEVKEEGDEVVNGELPGKQKIFVKTYGCSHNISDSEYMAGLLAEYGF
jgi:threonylcarbamoyladenosine tRNA methylthiotransferase CDKAL1